MADLQPKTLSEKLLQAQEEAKVRHCEDAKNSIYESIKSNPFIREVTIPIPSWEEAKYIEKELKGEGLQLRIISKFEISKKVTSPALIITLPVPKEKDPGEKDKEEKNE